MVKKKNREKIGVIGLGYVGLPLCLKLSKSYDVFGYDLNPSRVNQLKKKIDITGETKKQDFNTKNILNFVNNIDQLKNCKIFIVTVPTPIYDKTKLPDLRSLSSACNELSKILCKGSIVVFESTVYPGTTEEVCAKIIEKKSKLKFNKEFFCGYSPERINPGDKVHTVDKITKIVSASHPKILNKLIKIYQKVTKSIYVAKDIKTAEAAKIIENTQRDINIALINELSIIFKKKEIDIFEVLGAASTKWNFHKYEPGFVGGHCIGVDPYYLTYFAKKNNVSPRIILSGRYTNDNMPNYFFDMCKSKIHTKFKKKNLNILFLGLTFKENCPDIRNSQALKILEKFEKVKNFDVFVHDPYFDEFKNIPSIKNKNFSMYKNFFDVVILLTPHDKIIKIENKIRLSVKKNNLIFDPKNKFISFKNKITL